MTAILTPAQRELLEQGHALVCHCKECRSDMFLGELPMDIDEMVKLTRRTKCPVDKDHELTMGPLP